MEFGKLNDISSLDFSLPIDRPETTKLLRGQSSQSETLPRVYIGCTGWSMKEWVG